MMKNAPRENQSTRPDESHVCAEIARKSLMKLDTEQELPCTPLLRNLEKLLMLPTIVSTVDE